MSNNSDSELSERAKEAQSRAMQARAQSHDEVQSRIAEVRATADQRRQQAVAADGTAKAEPASSWDRLRAHVGDQMKEIHAKIGESHDKHNTREAQRRADWAQTNAIDAVDFAYDAVVEAEGAVLEAINLRAAADKDATEVS